MRGAPNIYDVVIVGGGPAGASAAIHLSKHGARVLLAEQKRFPREKLCGEFISPECLEHFERLGVMQRMIEAGGAGLTETVFYSRSGKCVSVPSDWCGSPGACEPIARHAHAFSASGIEDSLRKARAASFYHPLHHAQTLEMFKTLRRDKLSAQFLARKTFLLRKQHTRSMLR